MVLKNYSPIVEFSESFQNDLEARILNAKKPGVRALAAFDADGTLWDTDIGEIFFLYQIKNCQLANMPADPWKHYIDLKEIDRIKAYYWLAQINVGKKLSQVQDWAADAIRDFGEVPILKSNQHLIQFLKKNGVEVFVVTASVKWAVEPAAALVGVDRDHVIGIETEVQNGVVSDRPVFPATYRQGKAEAILKATGGVAPLLSVGNTVGDIALLNCSAGVKLAVRTQPKADKNNQLLEDELALENEAKVHGWLSHGFR